MWSFNGLTNGGTQSQLFSADVPPTSMFINGNTGGTQSYNASALAGVDGALFYPVNEYGTEFAFTDAFSVELFFKTIGDQSAVGEMQLVLQSEGFFRYAVVLNEGGEGNVRFAINDGLGVLPLVDIRSVSCRNFADGEWHYVLATYDPSAGTLGELSLTLSNEDGTSHVATVDIGAVFPGFAGLPSGVDSNMFIGRNTFSTLDDPRTFLGVIDEVQISSGIVDAGDRLGAIGSAPTPDPPPAETILAHWNMTPAPGLPDPVDGANPLTLDVRAAAGEGVNQGISCEPAEDDHLWMFNGLLNGGTLSQLFSADVPPIAMFANGNDGGSDSYNASAIAGVDGALFYPVGDYGTEFAFTDAFSVELFFKTFGDQSGSGIMQLLLQSEGFFRYTLVLNEAAPGAVRFAINDGVGVIPLADLSSRNYADGEWHYVLATYDPAVGASGTLTLTVANEDGSADTTTVDIAASFPGFAGLPAGVDANLFVGRGTFDTLVDPRTLIGLIDEIQISSGIVSETDRLGALPGSLLGDMDCDGDLDIDDVPAFVLALTDPVEYGIQYPGCDINNGDVVNTGDGVDGRDISGFVALLLGP